MLSDGAPHNGGGRRPGVGHQPKPTTGRRRGGGAAKVAVLLLGGSDQQHRPVMAIRGGVASYYITGHTVRCVEHRLGLTDEHKGHLEKTATDLKQIFHSRTSARVCRCRDAVSPGPRPHAALYNGSHGRPVDARASDVLDSQDRNTSRMICVNGRAHSF